MRRGPTQCVRHVVVGADWFHDCRTWSGVCGGLIWSRAKITRGFVNGQPDSFQFNGQVLAAFSMGCAVIGNPFQSHCRADSRTGFIWRLKKQTRTAYHGEDAGGQ